MSFLIMLLIVVGAVLLGLALAYVPMRILMATISRNIVRFIQRQRDRRREGRGTPERRVKAEE